MPYNDKIFTTEKEYTSDSEEKVAAGNVKFDGGKSPVYRGGFAYFPRAIRAVAAVSDFGAAKYAWDGWRDIPDGLNRINNALGRHILDEAAGETHAPDSGHLHAAHIAWNALARLELMLQEVENNGVDRTTAG